MAEFDTAQAVWEVAQELLTADKPRSANRALVNRLFNGEPPFTQQQADVDGIDTNVNFKEAPAAAAEARRQYYNNFLRNQNYFTVQLDGAPPHKSWEWSQQITKNINRCMKKSADYRDTLKGQFAQTAIHGVGPVFWPGKYSWKPLGVALDDFLIPSQTRTSFENLDQNCIVRRYTGSELYRLTHGPGADPGWNMKEVGRTLTWLAKNRLTFQPLDWDITPEKLVQLYQADRGQLNSDIVPNALVYDFYYREPEKEHKWYRCMVLASIRAEGPSVPQEFLYKKETPVAESWENLIHVQFGNGANTAPFLYHSVRGLGFMTFDLFHLDNRVRSKFSDHVFQQLILLFKINSPADQDRLQKVDLIHKGTLPEGLGFVTAQERFTVNHQLVQLYMDQNKRSLSNNSAAWNQDLAYGKDEQMTAFEFGARIQATNAMISGMLMDAYEYADRQYQEICRRFTLKVNPDPDVKKFKEYCKRDGVPDEWIDSERWYIRAERQVGDGNKILEMAQVRALMAALQLYSPEAQRKILNLYTMAHSDPDLANELVPMETQKTPDIVFEAQQDAGVMMMNLPLGVRQDINHIDYTETLLATMTMVVQQIEQGQGGMATPPQLGGLVNIGQHVQAQIAIIAQNQSNKERVRKYQDVLGQIENLVKAYAQRLQEQAEAQGNGQMSPETRTKMLEQIIMAQSKAKIKEAHATQKRQIDNAKFVAEMERKNVESALKFRDQALKTQADIAAKDAETAASIRRGRVEDITNIE